MRFLLLFVSLLLVGCGIGEPQIELRGAYKSELKIEDCKFGGMVRCDVTNISNRPFGYKEMSIVCLDGEGAILGEFRYPRRDIFMPGVKYRDEWFAECGNDRATSSRAARIVVSISAG